MTERQERLLALIDAYLDGTLAPEQRAEFERIAAENPALRAELDLQKRIDERLAVLMAPPEVPEVAEIGVPTPLPIASAPGRRGRGIPAWAKIAAVVVLVGLGAWLAIARPWSGLLAPKPSVMAANVAYQRLVEGGLKPRWVCDTDAVFLDYTKRKLDAPFLVKPAADVQLVGWTYMGDLLGESAHVLMARAGDKPVIAVMGKKGDDRAMRLDAGSPLHLHRREYQGVVMYEVSPLDKPVLIEAVVAGR